MNQQMHYFVSIHFINKPLHVSSSLAAHHREDQLCITESILLMMSSKPARNM